MQAEKKLFPDILEINIMPVNSRVWSIPFKISKHLNSKPQGPSHQNSIRNMNFSILILQVELSINSRADYECFTLHTVPLLTQQNPM